MGQHRALVAQRRFCDPGQRVIDFRYYRL